jgi:hypothetical protein
MLQFFVEKREERIMMDSDLLTSKSKTLIEQKKMDRPEEIAFGGFGTGYSRTVAESG